MQFLHAEREEYIHCPVIFLTLHVKFSFHVIIRRSLIFRRRYAYLGRRVPLRGGLFNNNSNNLAASNRNNNNPTNENNNIGFRVASS